MEYLDILFCKDASSFCKIYHEVILLMKFLHTKPQVKSMNMHYCLFLLYGYEKQRWRWRWKKIDLKMILCQIIVLKKKSAFLGRVEQYEDLHKIFQSFHPEKRIGEKKNAKISKIKKKKKQKAFKKGRKK